MCSVDAEEPNQVTAEEIERDLLSVETFLAGLPSDLTTRGAAASAISNVIHNLSSMPEEAPVRLRAINLARKYAAIPDYATPHGRKGRQAAVGVNEAKLDHARLRFAWGVLRAIGVLRDGMGLEELVALLGPPTTLTSKEARWHYLSDMHVNPGLSYTRSDDADEDLKKGQITLQSY